MHSPLLDPNQTPPIAELDLRDLETLVVEQIARKSGAARGELTGPALFAVQRVPMSPAGVEAGLTSAVDWLARRIRETGSATFRVSVRRQATNLVLVAEWSRPAERSRAALASTGSTSTGQRLPGSGHDRRSASPSSIR